MNIEPADNRPVFWKGEIVGWAEMRWQQTDPYTWDQQWTIGGGEFPPINFDTFDEASSFLCGWHARGQHDE